MREEGEMHVCQSRVAAVGWWLLSLIPKHCCCARDCTLCCCRLMPACLLCHVTACRPLSACAACCCLPSPFGQVNVPLVLVHTQHHDRLLPANLHTSSSEQHTQQAAQHTAQHTACGAGVLVGFCVGVCMCVCATALGWVGPTTQPLVVGVADMCVCVCRQATGNQHSVSAAALAKTVLHRHSLPHRPYIPARL